MEFLQHVPFAFRHFVCNYVVPRSSFAWDNHRRCVGRSNENNYIINLSHTLCIQIEFTEHPLPNPLVKQICSMLLINIPRPPTPREETTESANRSPPEGEWYSSAAAQLVSVILHFRYHCRDGTPSPSQCQMTYSVAIYLSIQVPTSSTSSLCTQR